MRSICKAIQADVKGALEACDYFEDITVVAEDKGDLTQVITAALGGTAFKANKTGVIVVVNEPIANSTTEIRAPNLEEVRQKITVIENREINRDGSTGTGKSAYLIGESILQLLFEIEFNGTTRGKSWPGTPSISPLGIINENQSLTGVEVMMIFHAQLLLPNKVATPTIANSGTLITLTCSTSGAAIKYSINGDYPTTPYTVPFATPATGNMVRAVGTLTTYAASNVEVLNL